MKKKLLIGFSAAIMLVMTLVLVACNGYSKVDKALAEKNYNVVSREDVSTSLQEAVAKIEAELEERGIKGYKVYFYVSEDLLTQGQDGAVIKFGTHKNMVKAVNRTMTIQTFVGPLTDKNNKIEGNCIAISYSSDFLEVFASSKIKDNPDEE